MKLWRCQICGDPYLGEERPKNCPFCGAHERYMVEQEDFENRIGRIEELSSQTKANLEAALEIEISNTEFYKCALEKAKSDDLKNLFKVLSKVESEHASLISKALGIQKPPVKPERTSCAGDKKKDLGEAHKREDRAVHKHGKFLSEATEPRAIEIFSALVAIEADHLAMHEEHLG